VILPPIRQAICLRFEGSADRPHISVHEVRGECLADLAASPAMAQPWDAVVFRVEPVTVFWLTTWVLSGAPLGQLPKEGTFIGFPRGVVPASWSAAAENWG